MDRDSLSVGAAAAQVGLTVHTLRWYEQEGLVMPVERDSAGRRRYSGKDIDRLLMVTRLRRTGMPVREMRRYAELLGEGDTSIPERLRMFVDHREQVLARIADLQRDLEAVDSKIALYREKLRDEVTAAR